MFITDFDVLIHVDQFNSVGYLSFRFHDSVVCPFQYSKTPEVFII